MKWKVDKEGPKSKDQIKRVKRFAWFPTYVGDNTIVWLCRYIAVYKAEVEDEDEPNPYIYGWILSHYELP